MNRYNVTITKVCTLNFEVEAEDEYEAEEKANDLFDMSDISSSDLFTDNAYPTEVELLES